MCRESPLIVRRGSTPWTSIYSKLLDVELVFSPPVHQSYSLDSRLCQCTAGMHFKHQCFLPITPLFSTHCAHCRKKLVTLLILPIIPLPLCASRHHTQCLEWNYNSHPSCILHTSRHHSVTLAHCLHCSWLPIICLYLLVSIWIPHTFHLLNFVTFPKLNFSRWWE